MQSSPASRCHHIRTNGMRCGALALRDHRYCYYHQRSRPMMVNFASSSSSPILMPLPLFEDAHAIQTALHSVVYRMLDGVINQKTAGLMLYALQIASSNLKHMKGEAADPDGVVVDLPRLSELPAVEKTAEAERMNSHTAGLTHYGSAPTGKDEYFDDVMRQAREMKEHPEKIMDETYAPDLPSSLEKAVMAIEGDTVGREFSHRVEERTRRGGEEDRARAAAQEKNAGTQSADVTATRDADAAEKVEPEKPAAGKLPPGTIQGCAERRPRASAGRASQGGASRDRRAG